MKKRLKIIVDLFVQMLANILLQIASYKIYIKNHVNYVNMWNHKIFDANMINI
jgi:hypothetical protein